MYYDAHSVTIDTKYVWLSEIGTLLGFTIHNNISGRMHTPLTGYLIDSVNESQ